MGTERDGLVAAEKIVASIMAEYYEKSESTRLYKLKDRWSDNGDGASQCLTRIQEALAKLDETE